MGALLAAGYRVYAINPRSAARYRWSAPWKRHHVGAHRRAPSPTPATPGCSDRIDLVRTDRHNHREVAGDSDEAAAVRILARAHQQLVWDRTRQTNRLRNALREYSATPREPCKPFPASPTATPWACWRPPQGRARRRG